MLRVWALEDNAEARQAISLFESEHPNIEVKLEVGLDNERKTAEDAIKNLNTEILSGEGPDVFILDGLPIDDFSKQGVFHDLSDIYAEARDSGQYYENLLGAFATEETCEILPMRYSFPLLISEKEIVDNLDSFSSLVAISEEIASNNPNSRVLCNMAIFDELFIASYPKFFNQGKLDEEALKQFFNDVANLSNIIEQNNKQNSVLPNPDRSTHDFNEIFDDPGFGQIYLLEDSRQILAFEPSWEQEFLQNEVFMQQNEADLVRDVLSLNEYACFTPQVCVAVSANSTEIDLAESFVQMMLSKQCQAFNHRDGLSVMTSVFDDASEMAFSVTLMDGTNLSISSLTEEVTKEDESIFASLDTPVVVDAVVQTAVYEQMQRFFDGEVPLEGALTDCSTRINLYLAE